MKRVFAVRTDSKTLFLKLVRRKKRKRSTVLLLAFSNFRVGIHSLDSKLKCPTRLRGRFARSLIFTVSSPKHILFAIRKLALNQIVRFIKAKKKSTSYNITTHVYSLKLERTTNGEKHFKRILSVK